MCNIVLVASTSPIFLFFMAVAMVIFACNGNHCTRQMKQKTDRALYESIFAFVSWIMLFPLFEFIFNLHWTEKWDFCRSVHFNGDTKWIIMKLLSNTSVNFSIEYIWWTSSISMVSHFRWWPRLLIGFSIYITHSSIAYTNWYATNELSIRLNDEPTMNTFLSTTYCA